MLKFLGQVVNNQIRSDMVLELTNAVEYHKWLNHNMLIEYCSLEDIQSRDILKIIDADELYEYVPVGTIEFVHTFIDICIKNNGSTLLKPMNVPPGLILHTGRYVDNYTLTDVNRPDVLSTLNSIMWNDEMFIKSNDKIKFENNGIYHIANILDDKKFPNGNYQISNIIADEILAEYRCFIHSGLLVGIQYYSGDFTVYPDIKTIQDIVKEIKNRYSMQVINCPAYTADVAVLKTGNGNKTVLIECHEFYSCGLYGFNDYKILPYMVARTYNSLKLRILEKV